MDWIAYKEGKEASIEFNSDTNLVSNPYPKDTESWHSWNEGWNSDFKHYLSIKGE
jgi:hypothetical protein